MALYFFLSGGSKMDKKKHNRSQLELKWEGIKSHARQAIRNVADRENRSIRQLSEIYIPNTPYDSVYHFVNNTDRYTIFQVLKFEPLIRVDDLEDSRFIDLMNNFISDVGTTVRCLVVIYGGLKLASLLNISSRTVDNLCDIGLLKTRSLMKILQNLDRIVESLSGYELAAFKMMKEAMVPAFKVGMGEEDSK